MPRVGSHSSGGSFSHSRGSSSSSNAHSSSSNSSYSSGSNHSSGGWYHHGHGPHYHTSVQLSGVAILVIFFMIFALTFIALSIPFWNDYSTELSSYNEKVELLRNDYSYYQELAENETPIAASAISYNAYQIYEGVTYYYITFEIKASQSPYLFQDKRFETTATYTASEAKNIVNDIGFINVCTNGYEAIQTSYNITFDKEYAYKLRELKENQEYPNITRALTFSGLGIVLIVVSVIILVKHNKKKNAEKNKNTINAEKPIVSTPTSEITYCSYCGSKLKANETKCPDCGARARK